MIDGRIIGKTANSSRGSHQRRCRIHAGDSRELNSATGTSGERHPLELSWLRWELVGDPVVGMCKAQETELPERDSCWQQAKFLAAMCQNVSSRHEEICLSPSSRLTFKSTACQAALTRRFNLHQRKPREFPLVFNCGLVWPPLPARRLSDTRDGPAWKDPYIKETVRVTWLIDIVPILTASKAATMSSSDQWIC